MPLVYPLDFSAHLPSEQPFADAVAIYGLDDPRSGELRYIGKTKNPAHRLYQHVKPAHLHRHTHRSHFITSVVEAGLMPIMRILAWVHVDEWMAAERFYIAEARRLGYRLVNTTDGGQGTNGIKPTPEFRAKVSATLKGHPVLPGTRLKMGAAARARWARMTAVERAKAVADARQANALSVQAKYAQQGLTLDEIEGRIAKRDAPKRPKSGFHLTPEHKAKIGAANSATHRMKVATPHSGQLPLF